MRAFRGNTEGFERERISGRLELREIAAVFGLVTPGLVISAVVSIVLSNWFPADPD
jgi:hypothetical protein